MLFDIPFTEIQLFISYLVISPVGSIIESAQPGNMVVETSKQRFPGSEDLLIIPEASCCGIPAEEKQNTLTGLSA